MAEGYRTHVVCLLAGDHEATACWQWLGFGMMAADAVRSLQPIGGGDAEVRVQRAGPPDVEAVMALDHALYRHLAGSPTFLTEVHEFPRDHYEELLRNPDVAVWLARQGARAVAYLIIGPAGSGHFSRSLAELLVRELIPASIAGGERWPILYPHSRGWEGQLGILLPGRTPLPIYRRAFSFNAGRFAALPDWRSRVPAGLIMERVDAPRLSLRLLRDGQPVSTCEAAFTAGLEVEIGIATAEGHRRQGLATLVGAAFIEYCLAGGLMPSWECFWDNEPSCALARRLGFERPEDRPVYVWEEKLPV